MLCMKDSNRIFCKFTNRILNIKIINKKLENNRWNALSLNKIYEIKLFKKIRKKKIGFKIIVKKILEIIYILFKKKKHKSNPYFNTVLSEFLFKKLLKPFNFFYFKNRKNNYFSFKVLYKMIKKILCGVYILIANTFYKKNIPYFINQSLHTVFQIFSNCPEQENQVFKLFLEKIENILRYSYSKYSCIFRILFSNSRCTRFFFITKTIIFLKVNLSKFFLKKKIDKISKIFLTFKQIPEEKIKKMYQHLNVLKLIIHSSYLWINKNQEIKQLFKSIFDIRYLFNSKISTYSNNKLSKTTLFNISNISLIRINVNTIFNIAFFKSRFNKRMDFTLFLKIDPFYSTLTLCNKSLYFLVCLNLKYHLDKHFYCL